MNAPATTPVGLSLYPPDGPQPVGLVLDTGFRIFKLSLVRCLLFGAMAMIAGQLPNIYSLALGQRFDAYLHGDPFAIVLALVGNVLAVYFSAVILLRQRETAQGGRQPTRAQLAHALRRLPVFVGVNLVSFVLIAAIPAALFFLVRGGHLAASMESGVLLAAGLLAIPVLWLLPGLAMSAAVAMLTSNGLIASLKQGVSLALGNWWRITLIFVVWVVLLAVLNMVAVLVLMMAMPLLGAQDLITLSAVTQVVFIALRAIGLPFLVAILLAVYGELQARKQGVDLERRLAGVAQA